MRKWTFVVAALFQLAGAGCNKDEAAPTQATPAASERFTPTGPYSVSRGWKA